MDAEPGAKLYMGFKNDISATELYNRCHDGSLEEVLNVIVPHKGDAFLMTPGLVHAASGGIVLAEIAESSDLDFKIYNWGILSMPRAHRSLLTRPASEEIPERRHAEAS